MVAHMNSLHISNDFVSHSSQLVPSKEQFDNGTPIMVPSLMSQEELEEKLRNAQSITVCEEVRKLSSSDSPIPQVLLDRLQKPCTALVVWQPPKNLLNVYNNVMDNIKNHNKNKNSTKSDSNEEPDSSDDERIDEIDFDNNNSSSLDLNNMMDFEML